MFDTDVDNATHEHCDSCNQSALRRHGQWITRRTWICAGCVRETHDESQSELADRCALTEADVRRDAGQQPKYVAIPALPGVARVAPHVPTLRRSESVPLWRGPCAECGMRGSSLMGTSCPRCSARPRAVST